MVGMSIGITGEKELRLRLRSARAAMTDFKPWLKQAALIAIESVQTTINQGGRPGWVALSEETIRKRGSGKTKGGSVKTLRDTGILMASISSPKTSEGGVFTINNFSVEVGSSLKYARPLHFGTEDGHIPPRPFMFLTVKDESNITKLLVEFLDKSFNPA